MIIVLHVATNQLCLQLHGTACFTCLSRMFRLGCCRVVPACLLHTIGMLGFLRLGSRFSGVICTTSKSHESRACKITTYFNVVCLLGPYNTLEAIHYTRTIQYIVLGPYSTLATIHCTRTIQYNGGNTLY